MNAFKALFDVYPEIEKLEINSLLLRYIDAVEFNFESDNIIDFMSRHMKTGITAYPKLFENTGVDSLPSSFDLRFSFPCKKPEGMINLRFVRGKKENTDALIWETMVQSTNEELLPMPERIGDWLNAAHDLTDDWFFKLIEGELERRFE